MQLKKETTPGISCLRAGPNRRLELRHRSLEFGTEAKYHEIQQTARTSFHTVLHFRSANTTLV
eukprot:1066929-Amphidinium_carterae.1